MTAGRSKTAPLALSRPAAAESALQPPVFGTRLEPGFFSMSFANMSRRFWSAGRQQRSGRLQAARVSTGAARDSAESRTGFVAVSSLTEANSKP